MHCSFHLPALTAIFGWSVVAGMCHGQSVPTVLELQEIVTELQSQNRNLQHSLAQANASEKIASEQLSQVRERLEALGKNLLDGGEDRLIQAAGDLQLANERISRLEGSISRFASSFQDYVSQAMVSDPDARLRVETSLRELDAVLGLRDKPRSDVQSGSLQQAKLVSIDPESGMLVLNLGERQGAKIGMTFQLTRGQQSFGKAILADVRRGVSGAFVENLDKGAESPRPGDLAVLETQASEQ